MNVNTKYYFLRNSAQNLKNWQQVFKIAEKHTNIFWSCQNFTQVANITVFQTSERSTPNDANRCWFLFFPKNDRLWIDVTCRRWVDFVFFPKNGRSIMIRSYSFFKNFFLMLFLFEMWRIPRLRLGMTVPKLINSFGVKLHSRQKCRMAKTYYFSSRI